MCEPTGTLSKPSRHGIAERDITGWYRALTGLSTKIFNRARSAFMCIYVFSPSVWGVYWELQADTICNQHAGFCWKCSVEWKTLFSNFRFETRVTAYYCTNIWTLAFFMRLFEFWNRIVRVLPTPPCISSLLAQDRKKKNWKRRLGELRLIHNLRR